MSLTLGLRADGRLPLHKHLHEGSDWAGYGLGVIGPALNRAQMDVQLSLSACAREITEMT